MKQKLKTPSKPEQNLTLKALPNLTHCFNCPFQFCDNGLGATTYLTVSVTVLPFLDRFRLNQINYWSKTGFTVLICLVCCFDVYANSELNS
jgi:hypothetical protein